MTGADFLQLSPAAAPARGLTGWLADAIRAAIMDGRLRAGTPLPATRLLAGDLGVSRGVIVEAYQRLADEGLVSARPGAGTRVLGVPRLGIADLKFIPISALNGDNVVTTMMEHNSNYVPWYAMCREILPRLGRRVEYRLARFDPGTGELDLDHLASLIDARTKLVCCTGASNFLGTRLPVSREAPRFSASFTARPSMACIAASRTRRSCQGDFGSHCSGRSRKTTPGGRAAASLSSAARASASMASTSSTLPR